MAEEENPDAAGMDSELADEWAAAMSESGDEATEDVDDVWAEAMSEQEVKPVQFDELPATTDGAISSDLDLIMDIPVNLSMELGGTDIAIRNLLQLTQGSVVELDRYAGEPLDVLVNGTLIAHGEVVVVNDKYGIRLTDVVSPSERIKRLK
ncbi:flagellar motor switch protein FliN [Marinomonas mediterranea]|jgi:flagellar motor switch protein FliN|uniref:Flagellar motor switch protein FliN n=1 Tax=Marinomonas mediterranea (strain ATCC 700492 / JCM 21426 / NBRC 103028 / MMB-1) TaxID=717774 RepID=F2K3K2_MARM1|nr:flagellar motor switch protein FliN [Marinomonas mediterranea]ADZ92441.1 flagellar motor switch protein FliN [Marinomonas mediterranea MMB-1]WCN10393.1 flagellar motor switch protein FliN [Marinomonas mediterranea]WCN14439.1 flagellar motor switch protein FliN [Marinomonas mediterranea]WCN18491.1 flagellar motor switch protein FliN [Marinomonas mediterranea MMB-1]